jgi:hypothetical protein
MPLFDCPECSTRIIGRYGDLLAHVRDDHPLAVNALVGDANKPLEERKTLEERIKSAQKARLKQRINEEMVVSGDKYGTDADQQEGSR